MKKSYQTLNYHRQCPSCFGKGLTKPIFFKADNLLRCINCGLAFEKRIPSPSDLREYYSVYSYSALKPCSKATRYSYRKVLETFLPWKNNGSVLDIGCGQGDFLSIAHSEGWSVRGFEFSPAAVALCNQRGLSVEQGDSPSAYFNNSQFSVVTAFEVIEHLSFPGKLLKDAHALLHSGGLLYLTTPNFDSLLRRIELENSYIIDYPGHLCLFNVKALRHIAKAHGFAVKRIETTGINISRLITRFNLLNACGSHRVTTSLVKKTGKSDDSAAGEMDILRDNLNTTISGVMLKGAANTFLRRTSLGDSIKAWLVKK